MSQAPLVLCEDGTITQDPQSCTAKKVLDAEKRLKLSKRVSGILRHFPHKYGLKLDPHGWVSVKALVKALRTDPQFAWVEEWHIVALAIHDPKGRFELRKGKIRARYGHSIPVEVEPLPSETRPSILYHATPSRNIDSILRKGIIPGKRTHVHLTSEPQLAIQTALRHGQDVVLLHIDRECVEKHGYIVEKRAPEIFVTKRVPPNCISRITRTNNLANTVENYGAGGGI